MPFQPTIYFCSDDFGMTAETCERIRQCCETGCLNKISVLPNTELPDIRERIQRCRTAVTAVHLNLVEGRCLSNPSDIPLLVNTDGHFCHSFTGLLRLSLSPRRAAFAAQVKQELRAQIARAHAFLPADTPLYLDSHQHVHMIPLLFRVLAQIVETDRLPVAFLRIPAEPLGPFLRVPSLYPQYLSVNLIKQWVLRVCYLLNRPVQRRLGLPEAEFFGILFSGAMRLERLQKLLPHYYRLARRRHRHLEVLFHPGYTEVGEPLFDPIKTEFHGFYRSPGRRQEYETLQALHREETCLSKSAHHPLT